MTDFLKLNEAHCKNCYKCIRHCSVKSIRFSGNQAHIVHDECILCGQCYVVCPQNAKEVRSDIPKARELLSGKFPVVVSLAPSFVANYAGATILDMATAITKLGFAAVEETAIGASIVKSRYEELLPNQEIVISSCCHSVNLLIQKHYPEALKYLARVVSPMEAHGQLLKRQYRDCKVVFIGPCISKKAEAENCDGAIDCVLTFSELSKWLASEGICIDKLPADHNNKSKSRIFPTAGGILKSMRCDEPGYTYLSVDGISSCIGALKDIIDGKLSKCFVEMSACNGSCLGGPIMERERISPVRDYLAISQYAGKEDYEVQDFDEKRLYTAHPYIGCEMNYPGHEQIESILCKMGKSKKEDELNCGGCGYDTCREKAIAVYQGKADLTMCLPFLKDRAESFSENIINNTPNAIIVLNERLEVQQTNLAARKLLNISREGDVLGESVTRILEPTPFFSVQQQGMKINREPIYLAEYRKYVEETIVFDSVYHIYICIMRDVTQDMLEKENKEKRREQTIITADRVVDKQMRVVQEIASLLGETAAETKIALTKLKESLIDE